MPDPLLIWAVALHEALVVLAFVAALTALRTRRAGEVDGPCSSP